MPDRNFFLSPKASKARLREAEQARKNRWEIINANSQGQVSRRDLIKMGLFTSAGLMLPISGLSPFARSAYADSNIPTGLPPSPLLNNTTAFSTPMPRFDVFPRIPVSSLTPAPTAESNQTPQPVDPALGGGMGRSRDDPRDRFGRTNSSACFRPRSRSMLQLKGLKPITFTILLFRRP
jgi:hypothetical protein